MESWLIILFGICCLGFLFWIISLARKESSEMSDKKSNDLNSLLSKHNLKKIKKEYGV